MKNNWYCLLFTGILFMFATISCAKLELETPASESLKGWQKISLNSQDNLKKILTQKDQVLIFSQTACYASKNLKDWEIRSIPERDLTPVYSDGPFPVLFKGRLYIEGKDRLYYSDDAARNWIPVSQFGTWLSTGAVAADENWLYVFNPYGSFRSSDGINFQSLVQLDILTWPALRQPHINIMFAKAESGKILLSGNTSGGGPFNLTSDDAGLTWQSLTPYLYTFDVSGDEKVTTNHSGYYFIAQGPLEIYQKGGTFWTLEKFKGDYYFAGETGVYYSDGIETIRGIIIKNDNFDSAFICPEPIRELEVIRGCLMAVGDKGAVYILR